jgi:ABC-type nitrate/sulfonate/bicarbonate transport system substrate-binding protein
MHWCESDARTRERIANNAKAELASEHTTKYLECSRHARGNLGGTAEDFPSSLNRMKGFLFKEIYHGYEKEKGDSITQS